MFGAWLFDNPYSDVIRPFKIMSLRNINWYGKIFMIHCYINNNKSNKIACHFCVPGTGLSTLPECSPFQISCLSSLPRCTQVLSSGLRTPHQHTSPQSPCSLSPDSPRLLPCKIDPVSIQQESTNGGVLRESNWKITY